MSLQLSDEKGGLNGWVVSAAFTFMTMILLCMGFWIQRVTEGWIKIGSTYTTIYLMSLGIWFGYKTIKTFSGGGFTTEQKP